MSAIRHSSVEAATVSPASYTQHNISLRTAAVWGEIPCALHHALQQSIVHNRMRDRQPSLPYHHKIFASHQCSRGIFFVEIEVRILHDSIPGDNRVIF